MRKVTHGTTSDLKACSIVRIIKSATYGEVIPQEFFVFNDADNLFTKPCDENVEIDDICVERAFIKVHKDVILQLSNDLVDFFSRDEQPVYVVEILKR